MPGIAGSVRSEIVTAGASVEKLRLHDFRLPPLSDVQFGLPRFIKSALRNHLTTRPEQIMSKCVLCGACVRACPPQVIRIEGQRLVFDYHRCIRCFCCRELCPEKALAVRKGILLKILGGKENNSQAG